MKAIDRRVKDIVKEKERIEDELLEAKEQTEKIRKEMFVGYQDIISQLKN